MKRTAFYLLSFCTFIAGFLLTAGLLRRAHPLFDDFVIQEKLLHLERHIDDYDTLFLGSSRVYHQISPEIFDQMSREAGMVTRSFNMGMDALFPPEDSYIAEYIASLRPSNLRWVFVEVSMFLPNWSEKSADSSRSVYWHDWPRTSMAMRDIFQHTKRFEWRKRKRRQKNWRDNTHRAAQHVQMFARNRANLGRGGGLLGNALSARKRNAGKQGLGRAGYSPLAKPAEGEFDALKDYDRLLTVRAAKGINYRALSPVGQENLERVLKAVRDTGATPVLVLSPVLTRTFFVPRKPAEELYLDFADIYTWPELYKKEHFVDLGHLSESGAELYTRYIAEQWIAAYGTTDRESEGVAMHTVPTVDVNAETH